jgi:hypothetical protein
MNSINKYLSCFCVPGRVVHAKVRMPEPGDRKQLKKKQESDVEQSEKTKYNRSRQ